MEMHGIWMNMEIFLICGTIDNKIINIFRAKLKHLEELKWR
jgi:hypothetical protein